MIKYREILRLHAQEVTQRGIASSCGHSRNTIRGTTSKTQIYNVKKFLIMKKPNSPFYGKFGLIIFS